MKNILFPEVIIKLTRFHKDKTATVDSTKMFFFFFIVFITFWSFIFCLVEFSDQNRSFKMRKRIIAFVPHSPYIYYFSLTQHRIFVVQTRQKAFCSVVSNDRWAKSVPIGISYFGHIITSALNVNNFNGLSSH